MEVKKTIINDKNFEYVTSMESDEYEINEFDFEDTLDLGPILKNDDLEKTIEIEVPKDDA